MKNFVRSSLCALIFGLGALASGAHAATATGTMNVSASVTASCKIQSIGAIAFGAYDPANVNASSPLTAAGNISVSCTKGDAVSVTLDQGANALTGSTCAAPTRQMANGTNMLGYAVYSDTGYTKAWGCDATNTVSFTSAGAATPTQLSTYGKVPGGQDVPAGNYSDTVTVSVSF